ncbi:MAG: FecR family protein [Devosia sp.]
MRNLILAGLMLGLGAVMAPTFASNEGTAVGVDPQAVARINTDDRVLTVGDGISVGETLVTGPRGQVQIIFADDTHMVVGPNSALLIEKYLMRNDGTAEKLAVNALAGSFRFITGHSPKPAYQINTPTAAIAVRGTEFDILVLPNETRVMLYKGALQLCSSGDCAQVTARCEVGVASSGQALLYTSKDPGRPPLAEEFRYARFQSVLMSPFRVTGASQCLQNASAPSSEQQSSESNSPTNNSPPTTPPPSTPPSSCTRGKC